MGRFLDVTSLLDSAVLFRETLAKNELFLLDFRGEKSSAGTGTETEMVCISMRSYSELSITLIVVLPLTTKVK